MSTTEVTVHVVHLVHPTQPGQEALASGAQPVRACQPDTAWTGYPDGEATVLCPDCQDVVGPAQP